MMQGKCLFQDISRPGMGGGHALTIKMGRGLPISSRPLPFPDMIETFP